MPSPLAGQARPAASPIVMRLQLDQQLMQATSEGYRIKAEVAARVPLRIKLFNLAKQAHELKLTLSLAGGGKLLDGPQSQSIRVPAEGSAQLVWQADLSRVLAEAARANVRVTAVSSRGQPIAPLVIDLIAASAAND